MAEVSRRHSTAEKKKQEGQNMKDEDMTDEYIWNAKNAETEKKKNWAHHKEMR